ASPTSRRERRAGEAAERARVPRAAELAVLRPVGRGRARRDLERPAREAGGRRSVTIVAGASPRTSSLPRVPLRAAAALFLERQHLRQPRGRAFSTARVVRLAADTGGLQIDSINVIDRAHYLTVWSRFGAYDKTALDRIVYARRALFEYWAHAA